MLLYSMDAKFVYIELEFYMPPRPIHSAFRGVIHNIAKVLVGPGAQFSAKITLPPNSRKSLGSWSFYRPSRVAGE